jgi:antitoxin component YwqK of YwqJK toxin-antitoxin module/capsular polysaccharide biosynthesis protein
MFLIAVTTCVDFEDYLENTLPYNRPHFDSYIIVTAPRSERVRQLGAEHDAAVISTEKFCENGAIFNKGRGINEGLKTVRRDAWVVHIDSDILLPADFRAKLAEIDLDSETIYGCIRQMCPSYSAWKRYEVSGMLGCDWEDYPPFEYAPSLKRLWVQSDDHNLERHFVPLGFFQLFSMAAAAARSWPIYPDDAASAAQSDIDFSLKWKKTHLIESFKVTHLPSAGPLAVNWEGRRSCPFNEVEAPRVITNPLFRNTLKAAPGKHGHFSGHFKNGQKSEEGELCNGLANGKWIEWHENGTIENICHYSKGRLHGKLTRWSPTGQKVVERRYKNGRLEGPFATWHSNGQKAATGDYRNGRLHGSFTEWYENGQLAAAVQYHDGKKHKLSRVWHHNGQEAAAVNFHLGREHGHYTLWYDNGVKSAEGEYWHGSKHGPYMLWYRNGQKAAQGQFRNGTQHGHSATWQLLDESSARLVPREDYVTLRLVENLQSEERMEILFDDTYRDFPKPAPRGVLKTPGLASRWQTRFSFPDLSPHVIVASLSNAFVGLEGLVFDMERIFPVNDAFKASLQQLCRTNRGLRWFRKRGTLMIPALSDIRWPAHWPVRDIYEHPLYRRELRKDPMPILECHPKLVTIVQKFGGSYYHWLVESLPRLLIVRELLDRDPEIKVLVEYNFGDSFSNTWIDQYLKLLGIAPDRVVRYDPAKIYFAQQLYLSTSVFNGMPPREFLQSVRRALLPVGPPPAQRRAILVIDRSKASCRRILNHQELMAGLRTILPGEEIIEFDSGSWSVPEQIRLFARAKAIIGMHGAGLSNMVFSAPGTTVIEIIPADYSAAGCMWYQAAALGIPHWLYMTAASGIDDDLQVPVDDFISFVKQVLWGQAQSATGSGI